MKEREKLKIKTGDEVNGQGERGRVPRPHTGLQHQGPRIKEI